MIEGLESMGFRPDRPCSLNDTPYTLNPSQEVQGGDATGTGDGCESIYGQPYPDEVHPRLKFRRVKSRNCQHLIL